LKTNQVDEIQETLQVTLDRHELEKDKFTQAVMSKYMPISVILGEVVRQVDSPLIAQQRYTKDFIGVQEPSIERVIRECDKNGETLAYISSAIALHGVRISIGRVLSGTMHNICNMYTPSKQGPISSNRRKIAYIVSPYVAEASKIYCGNLVAIIDFQGESTVLSTCDGIKPFGLLEHTEHVVKLKFDCATSVASILRTIERSTNVNADQDDDGSVCITGRTVAHVKHAMKVAAIDSPFTLHAVYRETVVKSGEVAMGLSPNRANRFYISATPVDTNCSCLEEWKTHYSQTKVFSFEHTSKCNILVDNTVTGAQCIDFKLDSLCASFTRVCEVGVLCGQELFGVQFTVHNITTHSDLIHVGHGQVFLGSRKAFNKAQILADTRLMEPVFEMVIECMEDVLGAILDIIMNSNGSVCSVCTCSGIVYSICFIIPVQESFTLEDQILTLCNRKALISSTKFCRWDVMASSREPGRARDIALRLRKEMGLKDGIPEVDDIT
jgi:elongation factor 2